jgi:hypothetical protein
VRITLLAVAAYNLAVVVGVFPGKSTEKLEDVQQFDVGDLNLDWQCRTLKVFYC